MGLVFKTNTWGSGEIRGKQIAQKLGVPFDEGIDRDSIVVVVKAKIYDVKETLAFVKSLWFDVVDGYGIIEELLEHPEIKAIAIGPMSRDFIARRVNNDLVVIPEHHCNFENVVREDRDVKVVGAMCYPGNFDVDANAVRDALESIGLEFRMRNDFKTREDVVEFYKSIDIQLCVRFWRGIGQKEPPELKNPLKLENAGSFKIPTVAYPEPCFMEEFGEDKFIHVFDINDIVESCKILKSNKRYYDEYAERAWVRAQDYHIDKIAPLYLELD
jgi:hypothetical protein